MAEGSRQPVVEGAPGRPASASSTAGAPPARPTGTAPEAGREGSSTDRPDPAPPRGRRRARLAGVVTVAVLLGGGAAVALGAGAGREPVPAPPPETVVVPSPTPTVAPVARAAVSPFADGLPSSVLAYALTGLVEESSLLAAGALEGYRLDYADGAGGTVTVLAAQWATAAEAQDALARAVAAGPPLAPVDGGPTSGEVTVDGAPAGAWSLAAGGDGAAALTWTNGTALLQVTGPLDVVRDVHAAFPY